MNEAKGKPTCIPPPEEDGADCVFPASFYRQACVLLVGLVGCEIRLCAFVRPRVPCVPCVPAPPVSFYRQACLETFRK